MGKPHLLPNYNKGACILHQVSLLTLPMKLTYFAKTTCLLKREFMYAQFQRFGHKSYFCRNYTESVMRTARLQTCDDAI